MALLRFQTEIDKTFWKISIIELVARGQKLKTGGLTLAWYNLL